MIRATILAPVLVLDEAANQQPIPVAAGASALRAASAAWAQASFCDEAMPRATTSLPSMAGWLHQIKDGYRLMAQRRGVGG
jgi:hypothetical protein